MFRFLSARKSSPTQAIFRWFFVGFASFSLIFFVAILPLTNYCRKVFTELEINKSTQQMNFGISQLDDTVATIINASQSIYDDHRFYSLHYVNTNPSDIDAATCNQMRDYLASMVRPNPLIRDCALQFSSEDAVTPMVTTFGGRIGFYPFYFCIDGMTYDQWLTLLQNNRSGFLAVQPVTTVYYGSYDALIYSVQWSKNKYFFSSIDINDVRKSLIAEDDLAQYKLTIKKNDGTCLYTDLSDSSSDYHSVTQSTSSGGLTITIHIPNTALREQITPLYSFLGIYLICCILILSITILIGTHISSKPLIQIVDSLEKKRLPFSDTDQPDTPKTSFGYGFHYIQDQINSYEHNLHQYQAAIDTQAKVLQARFIEKALHGFLSSDADYEEFRSYFPDFPDNYCLVLMGLSEKSSKNGTTYSNPMAIIQYYLQQMLPHAYLQQMTAYTLLLVIPDREAKEYSDTINHLMENINREEPSYHIWGIISKSCSHPKDLPFAYLQLQDIRSKVSTDTISQLCAASNFKFAKKPGFQISDTMLIYTAIINGNEEVALSRLQSYAEPLSKRSQSVFQMFRSILLCIRQDHAELLSDLEIPFYQSQGDLYTSLEECIRSFCQQFQTEADDPSDSFAEQVKAYIDIHFVDPQLCGATLEEHFQCSFSKIRKTFSKAIGMPISSYISQKRMALANELLLEGEYSISDIALKCGFTNYNSFFKVYQKTYGHAPTLIKGKKNSAQIEP